MKEIKILSRRDWLLAILSGIFLAIHFATWITSLEFTSIASSVVLVSTTPLWVALLSPITIKEPIGKAVFVGLVFALLGGIVVGISDTCSITMGRLSCPNFSDFLQGQAFLGDVLAVCGAIAGAGYLLIGRKLRASMSLVSYISLVYGMAAIVLSRDPGDRRGRGRRQLSAPVVAEGAVLNGSIHMTQPKAGSEPKSAFDAGRSLVGEVRKAAG